ncbi:phenylacetate--CoA ligase family protein [Flavobacterium acetivorans]|uniref:phenylacetate--CoA ligase family protein n=1 Tax=Flavobacterium acetivorans TaxID=2893883 RepID=UPI001E3CC0D4|nr:phenylacetate--CoA ligase family protein [Flavobacterium sp. F-29]UFH35763.1 phenylacetate--CoA ligase family protein [Flavobacterium sp. F-29]
MIFVHKLLYKLGVKLRNPSLNEQLSYLKETDKLSLKDLELIQLEKCKALILFAYNNTSYYKVLFDEANYNPENFKNLEDLYKIPVTSKKTLIKENKNIIPDYKFRSVKVVETSGTTGESLKYTKDERWDSGNRAALFRYYDWYNVKPWDRNGYFWGYNIHPSKILKTKLQDFLQNRFRLFSYKDENIAKFNKKLVHAKYLHGYSSMIYEVAKTVNQLNFKRKYNLKLVKGTSEKIYEKYQEEVKKAFGSKIVSEYGAGESGLIAFECPEYGKMHVNMQNVILEEIEGQAVVTNLLSFSFPIIRYNLGDYITLASKEFKCQCGRNHIVLDDVLGRVGKLIHGVANKYPSLTLYYVFKNLYFQEKILLNYQAIQNEAGMLLLKIEQDDIKYLKQIKIELKKYFKNDLEVEILFNQKLHTMEGKLRDFISSLDD